MLDPEDPVAMHLLMETAMGDSQQFEVLSFEEIEGIKKEMTILTPRIDGTKRKLAIETKIRDAAQSINRLQSPTSRESIGDGFRRSPSIRQRRRTLSRGSNDMLIKTDDELAASVKKCEDLARDLWQQERRLDMLQKKLLEHTAGVLQMTHKGTLEKGTSDRTLHADSGFSSPRDSGHLFNGQHEFDDRSFYSNLDNIFDNDSGMPNKVRSKEYEQQTQAILETEQKLEDLNRRLRESIIEAGGHPPESRRHAQPNGVVVNPDTAILEHIDDLERGFAAVQNERDQAVEFSKKISTSIGGDLAYVNKAFHELTHRLSGDTNRQMPAPPQMSPDDLGSQISFLKATLTDVESGVQHISEERDSSASRSAAHEEKLNQYDAVVSGLWEILIGEESDARQKERPNEGPPPREHFSLQAFSSKIQSLFARTSDLREQKDILSRQIQQQRELNSKSDSEKDTQLQTLDQDLAHMKTAMTDVQERHERELDSERQVRQHHEDRFITLQSDHATLRSECDNLRSTFSGHREESDRDMQQITAQLASLQQERDHTHGQLVAMQDAHTSKSAELDRAQSNAKDLEGEIVRLQTEVTVARAELDGAYGTRAQRAAEFASNPALQVQVDELITEKQKLKERMQILQQELTETINDYDAMTRNSIEFEREREQLEHTIDMLRDRCESIEAELSEEKVRWLGVKSPSSEGRRGSADKEQSTSTGVLKAEFKKMMRETRIENMRSLKVISSEEFHLYC